MATPPRDSAGIEGENLVAVFEETTGLFHNLVSAAGLDPKSDFRNRDLRGMCFTDAELDGFDFSGSDLRGTNLKGAKRVARTTAFARARLDDDDRHWLDQVIGADVAVETITGQAPMNTVPSQRDVAEALEVISQFVSVDPAETPALFVMKLAQKWKERGGLVAGKPRHSDRYLDNLLRRRSTPIRSLTPKLNGKTQIKPADAEELVRLFLTHWDYIGDPHSNEPGQRPADRYKPLFTHPEIEGICTYVADRISEIGPEGRSAAEPAAAQSVPGEDGWTLVPTEFKDAAAYFLIGSGRHTVLVPREDTVLLGFRNLMDRLWEIDSADNGERMLIWTLDLGRRDFEDLESRLRFMNVQELIVRFKAMNQFKESRAEERWKWLQSRTVIILHDTRSVRPEGTRLPAFDPNHVLFSAIPPAWAGSTAFQTLYGTERVRDTNYTIFLKKTTAESAGRNRTEPRYEMHYFGHALLPDDKGDPQPRALRLPAPGLSYVEALGTVFQAAARTLGLGNITRQLSVDGMRIDSEHAIEKLRHHGFVLLRLDDFIMW